ncbi:MAG TPA: tRNA (adenosine(37)-N6)-dimethylallyltransferase MiaA [Gemmatimonadaceae bacterium]|nr:tRNA (adenosine(37)-N6)-dimethylallyltransferase MiaA [Gemmatimonadaceae bacterium]
MVDADIRVITGPTAAGKSAIALDLAERYGAVLISADSRQVYRRFDIGTAKPTAEERRRVPHVGIDIAEPTARFSAAAWAAHADAAIDRARAARREVVVVGGTGFYLRALFAPLFEEPLLDPERRRGLERYLAQLSVAELRRWCIVLDPARSHLGRAQLLRTIEVALLTGRPLSALHRSAARPPRHEARYLVVDPGASLRERIETRVDRMLAAGWADEVRSLLADVPSEAPAWNAAGYEALREAVVDRTSLERARERIVIETRQYAKRQRTWMRNQLPRERLTLLDPAAPDAAARADRWWRGEAA